MGNSLNSETADWNEETMKAKTTELKKQIEVVDHSMTGLAKSIDSMQVACKMLLLHQDKKEDNQADSFLEDESKEDSQSGLSLARELLRSMNESVTDHKFIAMEGLCKMIHLIQSTLQKTGGLVNEGDIDLALDTYLDAKHPYDRGETVSYYDKKIESLSTEVRKLMEIKRSLNYRIEINKSTEGTLIEEKKILQKEVDRLETTLKIQKEETRTSLLAADVNKDVASKKKNTEPKHNDDFNEVKDKLIRQTTELAELTTKVQQQEKELAEVTAELNELKDKKLNVDRENETIKEELIRLKFRTVDQGVQIEGVKLYGERLKVEPENGASTEQPNTSKCTSVEQVKVQIYRRSVDTSFVELLESKAKKRLLDIDSSRCYTLDSVQRNQPVIILSEATTISSYSRPHVTTVEGIEASENVALVLFHKSHRNWISSRKASTLKSYHPYSSLGGIFDVVSDLSLDMHSGGDNEIAVAGILNFISEHQSNLAIHEQRTDEYLHR